MASFTCGIFYESEFIEAGGTVIVPRLGVGGVE